LSSQINALSEVFPFDLNSNTLINENLGKNELLYKVNVEETQLLSNIQPGEVYIIDSLAGREIACHPYLIGEELKKRCLKAAEAFKKSLIFLDLCSDLSILHILRGASGYMVPEILHNKIPLLSIRTEYIENGYRFHSNDSRKLEVTYRNYSTSKITNLIIPDTFATGRSAEVGIKDLLAHGLQPERVILYGFISASSLKHLGKLCQKNKIELISFSICDITPLAYNNYDMPIYGLDESYYIETGKIRFLSGIIPQKTLERLISEYVAGMDQPGDWSERHSSLFNGIGYENGNIIGHLEKSKNLIQNLNKLNSLQDWYTEFHRDVAKRIQQKINEQIIKYRPIPK